MKSQKLNLNNLKSKWPLASRERARQREREREMEGTKKKKITQKKRNKVA